MNNRIIFSSVGQPTGAPEINYLAQGKFHRYGRTVDKPRPVGGVNFSHREAIILLFCPIVHTKKGDRRCFQFHSVFQIYLSFK